MPFYQKEMLTVTVIFTVIAALSISVRDIECRSLPGLDVRDLLKSLKNQLQLNQVKESSVFLQKNNGLNEGLDFEDSDTETRYGSLKKSDIRDLLRRQDLKQRSSRRKKKLNYKLNVNDELLKLIGDKNRETDEPKLEKKDFSDLSTYSNVYLILDQEAVKKSKHKNRLNDVLIKLLGNEPSELKKKQRRYKGFVLRDDTESRRLNNRNKDSGEEEEDWPPPNIQFRTFVVVPFSTSGPDIETETTRIPTKDLLFELNFPTLPVSELNVYSTLPAPWEWGTLDKPSVEFQKLVLPSLDLQILEPSSSSSVLPKLDSPTLIPQKGESPTLVPPQWVSSTSELPSSLPQEILSSTLVQPIMVSSTLVLATSNSTNIDCDPSMVSSSLSSPLVHGDPSLGSSTLVQLELVWSTFDQSMDSVSDSSKTMVSDEKFASSRPKNTRKPKYEYTYGYNDYYRITNKDGYPYGLSTLSWNRRIGVDTFSDHFRRHGGRMSDEREYRPKRGRGGDRGGGGGGGSGRTAIPYIRHHGDIYERDD